jgi:hypothetical protein
MAIISVLLFLDIIIWVATNEDFEPDFSFLFLLFVTLMDIEENALGLLLFPKAFADQ